MNATAENLEWSQPTWKSRSYELRHGGAPVAVLTFPRWYSFNAVLTAGGSSWDIYQPKFFSQEVAVRQTGCELPFARYVPQFWKPTGTLELPKGVRLRLDYRMWKNRYELVRENGTPVFSIEMRGMMRNTGTVETAGEPAELKDYPWLSGLVWYLHLLRRRQAAARGH